MSPTKNAGPEKGSDLTGLLYRENFDYNGNIWAPEWGPLQTTELLTLKRKVL